MAVSPLSGKVDNVTLMIDVEGKALKDQYQIVSIEVQKEMNRISTATLTFLLPFKAGDDKTFAISETSDLIPGKKINIKAGYYSKEESIFEGIIVNQGLKVGPDRANVLTVKCSDEAVKLTLGRTSEYYKDQKDSDILTKIARDHGLSVVVDATAFQHPQLIQYHAVNWDFILTRAQANGLLVYFDDDKLHIKKPAVEDSCGLILTYGKDVISFTGEYDARDQMPDAVARSWSVKDQQLQEGKSVEPTIHKQGNLNGKELSEVLNLSEFELHSTGPIDKSDLKEWAKAALLKARLAAMRGEVTFIGNAKPKLNKTIELAGFGARFNGTALISSVTHIIREGQWLTTVGFGLDPEWYFESRNVNAPPAGGLLPAIHGLQNGTVKKIDEDPDGEHRIQVDVPVIAAVGDGIWARHASYYATADKGHFFKPEVGDEVVLGFLNNDPRFPVILGSLYSSKIKPPYTADPDNSVKAIVTNSELKIEFNDKDKILTIETAAGNRFVLSDKDKSVSLQDQHGNKVEMTEQGIALESSKDLAIKAAGKIDIQAGKNVSIKSSGGDVAIEGLNVNAKAKTAFSAQGSASAELKASGNTIVKGAMVMIN